MDLREALLQIGEIRSHVGRSQVFRGYRAAPVAATGLVALAAMGLQPWLAMDPARELGRYLGLWIGAAAASVLVVGIPMAWQARHAPAWRRRVTWSAVEALLPCVLAGLGVTGVLATSAPQLGWLLPGLWQVVFGLGVFASAPRLPRATLGIAAFYLLSGLGALSLGDSALEPWVMGLPFGVGQLGSAAVLYWTLEREREEEVDHG